MKKQKRKYRTIRRRETILRLKQLKQVGGGIKTKMKDKEDSLTVAVRIRPISEDEVLNGNTEIISVVEDNVVCLLDPTENDDMNVLRVNRSREKMFVFDTAFGPFSTQTEVYNQTTRALVDSVLEGYNATIFAYGPTGAGKTFTMLGTDVEPGIMALTLNDLYKEMERTKGEQNYTVKMSYLEIYNEMIRDLLNPSSEFLDLREDNRGVQVAGLTEYEARTTSHVMEMLSRGNKQRMCEPTAVNKTSSRSHAVLQVTVEKKSRIRGVTDDIKTAKLFLIDLAGSERAAQTQNTGKRLIEGAHINRSLLALGNCINALTEKTSKYVNYRDSKLTRLLKDSLGGNCKTVMIAHVSPASGSFEESRNTLTYADRAKNIKLKAKRNQYSVNYHVAQYQGIISDLRQEIIRLKAQLVEVDTIERNTPRAHSRTTQHMEKLKDDLKARFQEQLDLRKELIDLEDSSLQFAVEYQRHLLVIDEWEQEQSRNRLNESRESKKKHVRNMFRPPKKSNKHYDPYDIEEKDMSSEKSPNLARKNVPEPAPADVIVAREELASIAQQQEDIEFRKKEVLEKLEQEKRENHNMEEQVLRQASNDFHREIIKSLCFMHEFQIRNIELESIALMKEYLIQQKELEMQRGDMRRGLVDEIMNLQKTLITENQIKYPNNLDALHELYKEQLSKDASMISSLHIENKRHDRESRVPVFPSLVQTYEDDTPEDSRANSVINTLQAPKVERLRDKKRARDNYFNDRDSVSSRHTLYREQQNASNAVETDGFSDAGSLRTLPKRVGNQRHQPQVGYNNNNNNSTPQKMPPPKRKQTYHVLPITEDQIQSDSNSRQRGKTFRVGNPDNDDSGSIVNSRKNVVGRTYNDNDRHSIASLNYVSNSNLPSEREEFEGRKRSASAGYSRERFREKVSNQIKLQRATRAVFQQRQQQQHQRQQQQQKQQQQKPGWNNHFKKGNFEPRPSPQQPNFAPKAKPVLNLPTLKKAKMVANSNSTLLVGYRNTPNDNLAVSGTSYVPKHAQPGFGRL